MDKINMRYSDNGYEYNIRIPNETYDWIQVARYKKEEDKMIGEWVVYNRGKLFFDRYEYSKGSNTKHNFNYSEEEKRKILETFMITISKYIYSEEVINGIAIRFGFTNENNLPDYMNLDSSVYLKLDEHDSSKLNVINSHTEELLGYVSISNDNIEINVESKYYISVLDNLKEYLKNQTKEKFKTK